MIRIPSTLALLLSVSGLSLQAVSQAKVSEYVGSQACNTCHSEIYDRWKKTRMANVVRDPKEHPDAILPDLSKQDRLVTFTKEDVAFVYGSKWKQRYFKKVGDDYFVFPAQWDITNQVSRPYFVKNGTDWWAPLYPPDNMKRPTGPLCDGCHSVKYDIQTKAVTEWNVGCERCHGPGRARSPSFSGKHHQPCAAGPGSGERYLHSMPFTGASIEESDRGPVLRLAGGISRWSPIE